MRPKNYTKKSDGNMIFVTLLFLQYFSYMLGIQISFLLVIFLLVALLHKCFPHALISTISPSRRDRRIQKNGIGHANGKLMDFVRRKPRNTNTVCPKWISNDSSVNVFAKRQESLFVEKRRTFCYDFSGKFCMLELIKAREREGHISRVELDIYFYCRD